MIDGNTAVYALLGGSVPASLSPAMQNAAFRELGVNALYVALSVEPGRFGEALRGAVALGLRGLNVTIPFKETAFRLMDETDESAALAGAVNTVVIAGSRTRGYNTDGAGFIDALKGMGFSPAGSRVFLLGAGGAARAVAVALAGERIASLTIMNRSTDRAAHVAEWISDRFAGLVPFVLPFDANDDQVAEAVSGSDLVVQATPCLEMPRTARWLNASHTVVDLITRPTPLVAWAAKTGCLACDGRAMLVHQGARAFALWTGHPAPLEVMGRAAGNNGISLFD